MPCVGLTFFSISGIVFFDRLMTAGLVPKRVPDNEPIGSPAEVQLLFSMEVEATQSVACLLSSA